MDKNGFTEFVSRKQIKVKAKLLEEDEVLFSAHGKSFVSENYYQVRIRSKEHPIIEFYMHKDDFNKAYIEESIA